MTRTLTHPSLVGAFCCVLLAACGDESADGKVVVEGTVTFDGEPVEKGSINFIPTNDQGATSGGAIVDGEYSVETAPGPKKVTITGEKVVGQRTEEGRGTYDVVEQYIPASYNSETTLTCTVAEDGTVKDFELKSQPD